MMPVRQSAPPLLGSAGLPFQNPGAIVSPSIGYRPWLFLLLAAGLLQRLVRYVLQFPIWGDEAFICLNVREKDWLGLAGPLRFDQVAPVFFLWAEALASRLLGASELTLRLPSLIGGSLALILFARLAWLLLPPRAALLAAGLLAVSYYPVRHACEVKPYAFDLCAAVLLLTLAASWMCDPGRRRPLLLLVLVVPVAGASSYPAVFVAGAVSLALFPAVVRCRDRMTWLLFALFNILLATSFMVLFWLVGRQQHAAMVGSSSGYWDASFPPGKPGEFLHWLFAVHAGNMLAYPVGGRDGGSLLTLLCCLAGICFLARAGRRGILLLLLIPFLLNFLAAALGMYPYGGSARVAQHLAPSICLLAGAGLAGILKRCPVPLLAGALVTVGLAGVLRDVYRPYKTEGDRRARELIIELDRRAGPDELLIVCNAPPRLYPSLEWYLKLLGERVIWVKDMSEIRPPDETTRFWSLHFLTNSSPEPVLPPHLSYHQATFALKRRELHSLLLGPEVDATRACVVCRWELAKTNQVIDRNRPNRR